MIVRCSTGALLRGLGAAAGLIFCAACATEAEPEQHAEAAGGAPVCTTVQANASLPAALPETSGVEFSRGHEGILWTHNDSGEPDLFAVRSSGALVGRVRLHDAEGRDLEDIALGPCPSGACLHLADIGDNGAKRDQVRVYRVPEPAPGAQRTAPAEVFAFRYPEGPRDAEALFVLPSGEFFVVTKGRTGAPTLYRYPLPLRAGEVVTLEPVARLAPDGPAVRDQVTGAAASPDGEWVAVRTYQAIAFFRTRDLVGGDATPAYLADLNSLGEIQGEGIALGDDGTVILTSEGAFESAPGTISVLRCRLGARP